MKPIVSYALPDDIPAIKGIAQQYPKQLGFVNRAALLESYQRSSLYVVYDEADDYKCIAFMNFRRRRDLVTVIYEIAVHKDYVKSGLGRMLIEKLSPPIRLKCPTDNAANGFYAAMGFKKLDTVQGRKRQLNVWEYIG